MQIDIANRKILDIGSSTQNRILKRGRGWPKFILRDELLSELKKYFSDTINFCCFMKKTHKTNIKLQKSELRTRITAHKSIFEWNISLEYLQNPILLQKSYFYLETTLYQISIEIPQDDVIVIVRNIGENFSTPNQINGEIALLDVYGNKAISKKDSHVFEIKNSKKDWDFPSLILKKQLLDDIKDYEKEGTIVLSCDFFVCQDQRSETVLDSNSTYLNSVIILTHDFRKLFADKTNSDVILRVGDNVEIPAHRSVLAARSPVFSTMFNCDMVENRNSVVDIMDIDVKSLDCFLQFLYFGEVDSMDYEMASKLLMVAEKYQVDSLKEKCSLFLISVLSVENICEILLLADMVEKKSLKDIALNYAAKNFLDVFPSTEMSAWIMENGKLFIEVLSLVRNKCKLISKES